MVQNLQQDEVSLSYYQTQVCGRTVKHWAFSEFRVNFGGQMSTENIFLNEHHISRTTFRPTNFEMIIQFA